MPTLRGAGYNGGVSNGTWTALPRRVLEAIKRNDLLRQGDRVVVAVSGGADSMALLEALAELREPLGLWLCVAHLNHGLRGDAAAGDAEAVASRAAALGTASHIGRADVAALRRHSRGSLEAVARRARYAFLEQVASEVGATRVALGHTADDQAETILLGLLRGGELAALCGMPRARPLSHGSRATVVRPLLDVSRREVVAYLSQRGLSWRDDSSNADLSFERNRVRHDLLPALEARLGPGFREEILQLGPRAAALGRSVDALARSCLAGSEGDSVALDAARAASLPRLVQRTAARLAFEQVSETGELRRRAVDAIEGLLCRGSGKQVRLTGGLVAERCYGVVRFGPARAAPPPIEIGLPVPGRVELPDVGLWIEAEELEGAAVHSAALRAAGRWEETVDLDQTGERLVVRSRRPGDRFVPFGGSRAVKLKDFLMSERVPRAERDTRPVVIGRCGIAWVVGIRLDARVRITPATRRAGRLRAGRLGV